MNIREAAEKLGYTPDSLYYWIRRLEKPLTEKGLIKKKKVFRFNRWEITVPPKEFERELKKLIKEQRGQK